MRKIIKQKMETDKDGFVFPKYEDYSFANIPNTVMSLLGIEVEGNTIPLDYKSSETVIFFLIDGLGYSLWQENNSLPLVKFFEEKGDVFPITAVFPSTTAAALTTLSTGTVPALHGLFEWNLYLEEVDEVIETLPFRILGEKGQDTLLKKNVDPKVLVNQKTIFKILSEKGVCSTAFLPREYEGSAYSKISHLGAETIPYVDGSDLITGLKRKLNKVVGKNFFFVYFDKLDTIEHIFGPKSEEVKLELSLISHLFFDEFINKLDKKRVSLLISADHGHITTNAKETIYLNNYKIVTDNFRVSVNGKKILPSGSARDLFLQIEKDKIETVYKFLSDKFSDKAKIIKIEDAIKSNLFGSIKPTKRFLERAGDIVILPKNGYTFSFEYIEGKKYHHVGHHGGLSFEEMVIPFGVFYS